MCIVFMGASDLVVTALRHMTAWSGCEAVAAYYQPDRPVGRGHKPQLPAVRVLTQELGIPAFQPLNFRDEANRIALAGLRPDVLVVTACGLILPQSVLDIPAIGPFNVHGLLLPRYQGVASTQWAIMDGNHLTGTAIIRTRRGLGTGPMLLRRALGIGIDDTVATMHDELTDLGGRPMVEMLWQYADGDPSTPIPQEEALATYAAKLTKVDGHIDWNKDVAVIHARIRGVTSRPGAQTVLLLPGRNPLPTLSQLGRVGEAFAGGYPALGTLVALRGGKLLIACRDALYEVSTLEPVGGKPMSMEIF